jgi:hypothetical protein
MYVAAFALGCLGSVANSVGVLDDAHAESRGQKWCDEVLGAEIRSCAEHLMSWLLSFQY